LVVPGASKEVRRVLPAHLIAEAEVVTQFPWSVAFFVSSVYFLVISTDPIR
jgi:hypothetical protein